MTESPLITDYRAHLKKCGTLSVHSFVSSANRFMRWLHRNGRGGKQSLTPIVVSAFLKMQKDRGLKYSSLARMQTSLRNFFGYCAKRGLMPKMDLRYTLLHWLDKRGSFYRYGGVLGRLIKRPDYLRRYVDLPFAKELEKFLKTLPPQGYSRNHMLTILRVNAAFQRYIVKHKRNPLFRFVTPEDVRAAALAQTSSPEYQRQYETSVRQFLAYTVPDHYRSRFVQKPAPPYATGTLLGRYLLEYEEFCRVHKGLRDTSIRAIRLHLKALQNFLNARGITRPKVIVLSHLETFLSFRTAGWSAHALGGCFNALRGFLRFLSLRQYIEVNLADRLYRPSRFRDDRRPKYVPWSKIQTLLAAIDKTTPEGKRNYAILLLFTSYGLRAREVRTLRVDDIDFEKGILHLRERKGGEPAVFPLRPEAGQALKTYLGVRPNGPSQELFLTHRSPNKPFASKPFTAMISKLLRKHLGRLQPHQGAYMLRHSFAKAMLDQGARMTDVAAVLGHKCLTSTLIYTRVATPDLREVANTYADLL